MADSEQRSDKRVALRLGQQSLRGVDENHRQISGRSAGSHVARVLFVAWCVGDDEFPPRRAEITVRDVNRNALFTLGP